MGIWLTELAQFLGQRKRIEAKQRISNTSKSPPETKHSQKSVSSEDSSSFDASEVDLAERLSPQDELWRMVWGMFFSAAERSRLDREKLSRVAVVCKLGLNEQQKLISEFERWAQRHQRVDSPCTDHLLVLVKFNVFRAMVSNGGDLGYTADAGMVDDDALSPFTDPSNPRWHLRSVPADLQPTRLQRQIPHHPWIDILPSPVMRDNLLLAGDSYDEMELCADLVGFFSESKGRTGMIVWGEPWDAAGWEVTESFVKHWFWTIRGCEQLLRSTNYWRQRRGEGPLQVEKILYEIE